MIVHREVLEYMLFESKIIPSVKIKINGKIKKAIDAYSRKKVPMRAMLTDFLAVKSKKDELAAADNPWAYFYKGIEGHEVESGVSHEETLFRFAAMTLKDQEPSDVINAAFYANKKRNDSDFELGYVLPLFLENTKQSDRILVVNPSPDIVCHIEKSGRNEKRYYAVVDSTVAGLYKLQFPNAEFLTFELMNTIKVVDAVLITNRDQKVDQVESLLNCLSCCGDNTKVMGLVPCAWLDNPKSGVYIKLREFGLEPKQILLVDSKATMSTPRKKMILLMGKGADKEIQTFESIYDEKTRQFFVPEKAVAINAESYLKTDKTILACLKEEKKSEDEKKTAKYNKSEEYRFSEEISLFYKVYPDRKNKYAGIAHYKEIKNVKLKTWGKKISADIEKGLRANSKNEVIGALDNIVFSEALYPIIRADVGKNYISAKQLVSLKTIWFYCWTYLVDIKKYDHEYVSRLFEGHEIADCMPQTQDGMGIIEVAANSLKLNTNDIPYMAIEQLDLILKTAVKHKIITYDPLEAYVAEYTSRATERQQDVRNALVKKHFSSEEESRIFSTIIKEKSVDGKKVFSCTQKSLLLSAAIRLFTGMAIREVAALNWEDFRMVERTDAYQFTITKFTDAKGKIVLHSTRENWKRFRIVPCAKALSYLLNDRKRYLIENGIDEDFLMGCPIVLQDERLADMKARKTINHCKPEKISAICNELIKSAEIPENEIVLPDTRNDMVTDFNRYHGDIFLSNFRHKAKHSAYMTMGEINYMIGVNAPDTFSRYYCDYTNDFLQKSIVQKLCRWEFVFEIMITGAKYKKPDFGVMEGSGTLETGPFIEGRAAVDLIVKNEDSTDAKLSVSSIYGVDINMTVY